MNNKILKLSILPALILCLGTPGYSGDHLDSEKYIKLEISYLMRKLLDMKSVDAYQISSQAYTKPFLGICAEPSDGGITLTCITPGSQAFLSGLKTGDLVTKINGQSMLLASGVKTKKAYFGLVNNMQAGDVLKFEVQREDETMNIGVTVGKMHHPSFDCTVSKE